MSVTRGGLWLMAAQAWHALTGYVIFRVATEVLGDGGYGAFTTVLWTMTTLEVIVTEGVPRALALDIARAPGASRTLLRGALRRTHAIAVLLCGLLFVAAPSIAALWDAPELAGALRLSGLDFLAFAGFAIFVALANGLRNFAAQARAQFAYSTLKVVVVSLMLWQTRSVAGAMAGYALASFGGSVCAWLLARRLPRTEPEAESASAATRAWPFAVQSLLLLLLLNIDLWVGAAISGPNIAKFGLYSMAATLCRSIYFVLRAVGEALLPTVAGSLARADDAAARAEVRRGLALLLVLLLPIAALAVSCGAEVLKVLFGAAHHAEGALFLGRLVTAATAFTLLTVQVMLLNAAGAARTAVVLMLGAVVMQFAMCCWGMTHRTLEAVAASSAASAVLLALLGAVLVMRILGAVIPWGALAYSVLAAAALWTITAWWQPAGWAVFAYGALLAGLSVGGAVFCGVLPRRSGAARPQE